VRKEGGKNMSIYQGRKMTEDEGWKGGRKDGRKMREGGRRKEGRKEGRREGKKKDEGRKDGPSLFRRGGGRGRAPRRGWTPATLSAASDPSCLRVKINVSRDIHIPVQNTRQ
jgi:hypothetical protein